jgi:hypothetical protein
VFIYLHFTERRKTMRMWTLWSILPIFYRKFILVYLFTCLLVVVTPTAQVGNCSEIYLYFRCSILFMHGIWSDNTKNETVFVRRNLFCCEKTDFGFIRNFCDVLYNKGITVFISLHMQHWIICRPSDSILSKDGLCRGMLGSNHTCLDQNLRMKNVQSPYL